jgi:hypothetical protein
MVSWDYKFLFYIFWDFPGQLKGCAVLANSLDGNAMLLIWKSVAYQILLSDVIFSARHGDTCLKFQAEAERMWVQGQHGISGETLSQNATKHLFQWHVWVSNTQNYTVVKSLSNKPLFPLKAFKELPHYRLCTLLEDIHKRQGPDLEMQY